MRTTRHRLSRVCWSPDGVLSVSTQQPASVNAQPDDCDISSVIRLV